MFGLSPHEMPAPAPGHCGSSYAPQLSHLGAAVPVHGRVALSSSSVCVRNLCLKVSTRFANAGGYVMGICNGFQILTESGLLPGALLHNTSHNFICKNIYLKNATSNSLVTNMYAETPIKIPIAHAEGRYFANKKELDSIIENDQVLFYYCDENGEITKSSNPNGSLLNIAGICNEERNVFGMMPHPERAADIELNNQNGQLLFESIIQENVLL